MAVKIQIGMASRRAYNLLNPQSGYYNPDALAAITGLSTAELQRAMRMASNKTIKWTRVQFARQLQGEIAGSERLAITQKMLKQRVQIANAEKNEEAARMWVGLYNMNLIRFGDGRAFRTGHIVQGRYVEGGFRARMKSSGHVGIFYRLTSDRMPIIEEGVPIKQHAWRPLNQVMNQAEERLVQELKQAIKYLMAKKQGVA